MESRHRSILDACFSDLVDDMNPDDVIDYVIPARVLSDSQIENLREIPNRRKKARELIECVMKSGEGGYRAFVKALDAVHPHLAQLLRTKEVQSREDQTFVHPLHIADIYKRYLAHVPTKEYLQSTVNANKTMRIRGLKFGQSVNISLENVYIALQVNKTCPYIKAEFQRARRQYFHQYLSTGNFLDQSELHRLHAALGHAQRSDIAEYPRLTLDDIQRIISHSRILENEEKTAIKEKLDECLSSVNNKLSERLKCYETKGSICSIGEAYKTYRHMAILGDPGTGKTTAAKWVTLKMARALLDQNPILTVKRSVEETEVDSGDAYFKMGRTRLPFLIGVLEFADFSFKHQIAATCAIEKYIATTCLKVNDNYMSDLLKEGFVLVIMDGLDEVSSLNHRDFVIESIDNFLCQYGTGTEECYTPQNDEDVDKTNRLIVTSRISGNFASSLGQEIPRLTIEKINKLSLKIFFSKWMSAVVQCLSRCREVPDCSKIVESLLERLDQNQALAEMATTPQLANVIATVYYCDDNIPKTKGELYDKAIKNMAQSWIERLGQSSNDTGCITVEMVFSVLEEVGFKMQSNTDTIRGNDLEDIVRKHLSDTDESGHIMKSDMAKILHDLVLILKKDVGALTVAGEDEFQTVHRTFQEYLAGRYMAKDPSQCSKLLTEKVLDPLWRFSVIMAIGRLSVKHPKQFVVVLREIMCRCNAIVVNLAWFSFLIIDAFQEILFEVLTEYQKKELLCLVLDDVSVTYQKAFLDKGLTTMLTCVEGYLAKITQFAHQHSNLSRYLTEHISTNLQSQQKDVRIRNALLILPLNIMSDQMLAYVAEAYDEIPESEELEFVLQSRVSLKKPYPVPPMSLENSLLDSIKQKVHNKENAHMKNAYDKLSVVDYLNAVVYEQSFYLYKEHLRDLLSGSDVSSETDTKLKLGEIMENDRCGLQRLVLAISGGNNILQARSSAVEYFRTYPYTRFSDNQLLPFLNVLRDLWGHDPETIKENIKKILYSISYDESTKESETQQWTAKLEFKEAFVYKSSFTLSTILSEEELNSNHLIVKLKERLNAKSVSTKDKCDSLLGLLALGEDVSQQTVDGSTRQTFIHMLHHLRERLRDATFRASNFFWEDIKGHFASSITNFSKAMVILQSTMATCCGADATPIKSIANVKDFPEDVQPYVLAEFLAYKVTGIHDDSYDDEQNVFDTIKQLKGETLLFALANVGTAYQLDKPARGISWPGEAIPLPGMMLSLMNTLTIGASKISFVKKLLTDIFPEKYGHDKHAMELFYVMKCHLGEAADEKSIYTQFQQDQDSQSDDKSFLVAHILRGLLRGVEPAEFHVLFNAVKNTANTRLKAHMLERLAFLSSDIHERCLDEAKRAAMDVTDSDSRARLLGKLCLHVSNDKRPELVKQALDAVACILPEERRAETMLLLKPLWQSYGLLTEKVKEISNSFSVSSLEFLSQGKHGQMLLRNAVTNISRSSHDTWSPIVLAALVDDALNEMGLSRTHPGMWKKLITAPTKENFEEIADVLAETSPHFDIAAAIVLDQLTNNHGAYVCKLLPYFSSAVPETLPLLKRWQKSKNKLIAEFGALLLAESTFPSPDNVPHLVGLLTSDVDVFRFRAREIIHHPSTKMISVIGAPVVEALWKERFKIAHPAASSKIKWMAHDIILDSTDIMESWILKCDDGDQVAQMLISRLENVSDSVWNHIILTLPKARPPSRAAMLLCISRLLYYQHITEKQWTMFKDILGTIATDELNNDDNTYVIYSGVQYITTSILESINHVTDKQQAQEVVACFQKRVTCDLCKTLADVLKQENVTDTKAQLTAITECVKSTYDREQRIRKIVEPYIKINSTFMETLPRIISFVLGPKYKYNYYMYSIISYFLEICAAAVMTMPWEFAKIVSRSNGQYLDDLENRLVDVAQHNLAFPARRAALQIIGCMGEPVSRKVIDAIQCCMKDIPQVYKGALYAAQNLKHLHQSVFLPTLEQNLHHPSCLMAYSTAKLLTSLALRADSNQDGIALRREVLRMLADASSDPRSRRYVCFDYVDAQLPIVSMPRLDEVFVLQMLKICDVPIEQKRAHIYAKYISIQEVDMLKQSIQLVRNGDDQSRKGNATEAIKLYRTAKENFKQILYQDHSCRVDLDSKISSILKRKRYDSV